jgi:hypothetical protein
MEYQDVRDLDPMMKMMKGEGAIRTLPLSAFSDWLSYPNEQKSFKLRENYQVG